MTLLERVLVAFVSASAWLTVLASAVLALSSVLVLAAGFLFEGNPFYFPGDPPYINLAGVLAIPSFVLSGLLLVVTWAIKDNSPSARFMSVTLRAVFATSVFTLLVFTSGVLFRFSPVWAPVRQGIAHYGEVILEASGGDKSRVLSKDEFALLKQQFVPSPVEVELAGFGSVHLRMAHGVYPYVGVDFGEGRNALFDPDTMVCSYSD